MEEIWKDINGFEGYYQISNFGRVRSLDRIINGQRFNGKIMSSFVTKIGYIQTTLHKNHKCYKKYIHRLIMEIFNPVDNMENLDIDHIDRDKTNNRLDNLRWVTHKENMHAWNPPGELSKCIDCGKTISRGSIRCFDCESNRRRNESGYKEKENTIIENKDKIYEMAVSGMNVTEISKYFGMSWQTFGRICRRIGITYKIPKPPKEKKELYIPKKVKRINTNTQETVIFNSISEAAKAIEKPDTHIRSVCNGKRKSAYGYYWEYVD